MKWFVIFVFIFVGIAGYMSITTAIANAQQLRPPINYRGGVTATHVRIEGVNYVALVGQKDSIIESFLDAGLYSCGTTNFQFVEEGGEWNDAMSRDNLANVIMNKRLLIRCK
jgi:hypothetical protein